MKHLSRIIYQNFATGKKPRNLYEILQIPRTASTDEIKSSYYKLAKQYHPDTHQNKQNVTQVFKQINQAYNILKDSSKRRQYDQQNFTPEGQKKQYKFYNTQHTYGYNANKSYRKNPYQSTNPFQSTFHSQNGSNPSTNPYNSDFSSFHQGRSNPTGSHQSNQQSSWDQYVKNQHRKNVAENQKYAAERRKRANLIIVVVLGLFSVYIVGQLTFKIYQFGVGRRIRSYPQRLDPRQLRMQQARLMSRKNYS